MPKNNENKLGRYFNLPNPGLVSYFDIVRRGQPEIYRTNFAGKDKDVSQVLQEWKPSLETLSDRWPTLVEFENDLASKVGPMSVMKPLRDRMKDIDSYYAFVTTEAEPIDHRALLSVLSEWGSGRGIQPRNQRLTVERMRKSTNSGSPYFAKRRLVTAKTIPCTVEQWGNATIQRLPSRNWEACAVLGWRGQEGGPSPDDVKQRVVWMFPYAVNVAELQVYQIIIEVAQRFNVVPAWVSMDAVDERVTRLFDTKANDDLIICTDFSSFDQHFGPKCQEAAETILRGLLSNTESARMWLKDVFPIKYRIPLMYDIGKFRTGIHGMGSGSGGTNCDETLVHRALQYEAAQAHNQRLNPNSQCLGDDGIISYPGIAVDDVMRSYTRHGLEMNADKQYVSTQDCVYLRRWHHKDYRIDGICRGVYSTCRALGRLCEQERYYDPEIWSAKMVALRQLSIIENVRWHPLREDFAEFCMKRDRYRLGIDIPGFLDNIEAIAQESMELMPDFLGYTKTMQSNGRNLGISHWWIVNYLKSK